MGEDRANSWSSGQPYVWRPVAILGALALALLLAGLALMRGQRRVAVRGRSMAPLLEDRELVLADRLAYLLRPPRRGDIVLVRGHPDESAPSYARQPDLLLKRVVGLPGEVVTLARDRLYIDGQPLDLGRPVVGSSPGSWALGQSEYFLLSENVAIGTDSRHTGPVQRADLLGRAWLVYAPRIRRVPRTGLPFAIPPQEAQPPGQTRNVTHAIAVNA